METIRTRTVQRAAIVRPAAVPAPAPAVRRVQASSLRVSSPSDPAEKEADATAKKVVGMAVPESSVALVPGPGGGGVFRRVKGKEEEEKEKDGLPGGKRRKMESPYVARFAGALRRKDEVRRDGKGAPNVAANVAAEIQASAGSGAPLPLSVRRFMEPRFKADFSGVRIHTGDKAAGLSRQLDARAFAVGNQIFFGRGQYKPETAEGKELIAHELTHTVQQGAAPPQAQRSEDVTVTQQAPLQVQRLGLSDALDHFAGAANAIPGFRMFTIVLGVNPINMSRVERSAANILRALVEFIPGGALIVAALDNYGVFDRAGAWVEQQIRALGMTGSLIRDAINRFLNSLSWSDIFDLGGVWERAKSIFTEPIGRIIATAKSIAVGIIDLVKDAIVRPLAGLAEGTRGYDLLKAVMGRDPITGDPFPRNADTLIGGFMKLIGQEEVWGNLKRANAVARAWAWFQGALASLMGFVEAIPATFMSAVRSLDIADIVLLPRAFAKVAGVFGSFIGSFISWAGNAVWNLLEIVFDVVSPGAFGYIKKTGGALRSILRNPLPFVGNLVKAAKLGFSNFASNFGTHLKAGLIEWLTGSMPGIYIPKAFSLPEIVKFVFSVLGISWANIRAKLVKVVGEPAVKAMETGFDIVVTLVTQGPAAAWDKIKDMLGSLKDMVIGGITDFVVDAVAKKAVPKLLALFVPGAGFISAILTIYDTVMVFVNKISKIAQVVSGFINSIVSIASGAIGAAASRVENTLAGLLSLAISFLAGFAGLGNVSAKLMGIINTKVRAPIDKALDSLVAWIVAQAKKLGKMLGIGGKDAGARGAPGGDRDRSGTLLNEGHTVRARQQGGRLIVLMSSPRFMPVEEEIAHVRKHFVDLYLKEMGSDDVRVALGSDLDMLVAEKDAWIARYNAEPDPQKKEAIVNLGLDHFVSRFAPINQALEKHVGPWATIRVGDTISFKEGGKTEYALVTDVMQRFSGRQFALRALEAWVNPKGKKVPKSMRVSPQSGDVTTHVAPRWFAYDSYGRFWERYSGNLPMMPGSKQNPFILDWPKPAWNAYPTLYFGGPRPSTRQKDLAALLGVDPLVQAYPPSGGKLVGGKPIGIGGIYQIGPGSTIGPLSSKTTPGGEKLLRLLRPYGFDPTADGMQADHVHEIQLGGADVVENLWPLWQPVNSAAGSKLASAKADLPDGSGQVALSGLKRLGGSVEFYFLLR